MEKECGMGISGRILGGGGDGGGRGERCWEDGYCWEG